MKLSEIEAGEIVEIVSVQCGEALAERLKTLNVCAGKVVKVLRFAPFCGDEMLEAEGVRLAIRKSLAEKVIVCRTKGDRQ